MLYVTLGVDNRHITQELIQFDRSANSVRRVDDEMQVVEHETVRSPGAHDFSPTTSHYSGLNDTSCMYTFYDFDAKSKS